MRRPGSGGFFAPAQKGVIMLSAVISKMNLNGTLFFGTGAVSKLSCVCENDLMAAYASSEEDRLFTKYSPWGEMKIGHAFVNSPHEQRQFFVVALPPPEPIDGVTNYLPEGFCKGAAHVHQFRVESVTDFGGSKQVRCSCSPSGHHPTSTIDEKKVGELDWRMTIDNPPAVEFFVPGKYGYRVAFYDAAKFTRDTALADALKIDA